MADQWKKHHCNVLCESSQSNKSITHGSLATVRENEFQRYYAGQEAQRRREEIAYEKYLEREKPEPTKESIRGCVFAKSCSLPHGIIDHKDAHGSAALELLSAYGTWAIMGTGNAIVKSEGALRLLGSSITGTGLASRLGGKLSLALSAREQVASMAAGAAIGILALLLPNTTSADSAFYSQEKIADLTTARTRARLTVQQLPDGTIDAYGFYTGGKMEWEMVPVIKATARGNLFVADIGQGVNLIWTPSVNGGKTLGIPALEGTPHLPSVWIYPPTEKVKKLLVHPIYPPDYHDAIIWFPADAGLEPIYIVLSLRKTPGAATDAGKNV